MDALLTDVRAAARALTRRRFTTLVAGLCLATAIGLNTGVFSVVRAVLLEPPPFGDPDRLFLVSATNDQDRLSAVAPIAYDFLRAEATLLDGLAAAAPQEFDLSDGDAPDRVSGAQVTGSFLEVLDISPVLGGGFEHAGDAIGDPQAALISHRLWTARYGGAASALGSDLRLNGLPYRIVGVLPRDARFPVAADIWVPTDLAQLPESARLNGFLFVLARASSAAPVQQAVNQVERLGSEFKARNPRWLGNGLRASGVREPQVRAARPILIVLTVAAFLVLAVACLNVANLFLVHARTSARELGVRSALGASPARVARQELIRAFALCLGAALAGTVATVPLLGLLLPMASIQVPGLSLNIDGPLLLMALGTAALVSAAVGLGPVLVALGTDPSALLGRARGDTGSRGSRRLQAVAVGGQIAAGVVLIGAAASLVRHTAELQSLDPGFRVNDITTARVGAPANRYPDLEARTAFMTELEERLLATPGIESVGAASALSFGDFETFWSFSVEDRPPESQDAFHMALGRLVRPGFLETLDIDVIAGRGVSHQDRPDTEPVILVNRALAEQYWPGEEALGKRLKRRTYDSPFPWMRVVGVVEDTRERDLGEAFVPVLYFPHSQTLTPSGATMSLVLRVRPGAADIAADLRRAVSAVDPDAAVFRTVTMRDRIEETVGQRRLAAWLMGWFGALGLLLSTLGVYAVTTEAVQSRSREIGIRMALGATRGRTLQRILLGGGLLAVGGAVGGALVYVGLAPRVLATIPGLETGLRPLLGAALLLVAASVAATLRPAWRAAGVDPIRSMREE